MKKTENSQQIRWKAIIEIMKKYNTSSPIEIVKYLESDFGIKTVRQTVYRDLKQDLEGLTEQETDGIKSQMLEEIDVLINIAYLKGKSADKDALQAMRVYTKLFKTKADIINKFHEFKLKMKEQDRPIYNVLIGKQLEVDVEKIKDDRRRKKEKL